MMPMRMIRHSSLYTTYIDNNANKVTLYVGMYICMNELSRLQRHVPTSQCLGILMLESFSLGIKKF